MKRLISIMLSLIFVLCCASALAENKPGDTVTVTIRIDSNPNNACVINVGFSYDTSVLQFVSAEGASGNVNAPSIATGRFGIMGTTVIPVGAIGTVTFKIKDDAKPGTYPVKAELRRALDLQNNSVSVSVSGGSVTIKGDCTHDKTTARVIKEATPTEAGEKQFVCDNCGQIVKTEIIPALGPGQTDPQPEAPCTHEKTTAKVSKAATCTDAGERQFVCNKCSKVVKTETIPALGHDSGKWTVAKKPTATAEGLRELRCTRCGKVLASEIIPIITAEMRYNQSVSSLGIRFRDIAPELTSKWYMFTPLDLSQNGTQEIPLLAANVSVVGQATVTVQDGFLTVNYKMSPLVEMVDMAFTVLPDLSSVDTVEPEMERFAFGEPISIADDLGGDGRVLLYVLGHVNYDFADQRIEKHSPSSTRYMKLVESLKELMD